MVKSHIPGSIKITQSEALLAIYLLFHPSYPTRVARFFSKAHTLPPKCTSMKQQPHISNMMNKLVKKKLILEFNVSETKKAGRKPKGHKKNNSSRIFRFNNNLLYNIGGQTYAPKIDKPSFQLLLTILEECTDNELNTINTLTRRFKKFDYGTILLQLILTINEVNNVIFSKQRAKILNKNKLEKTLANCKNIPIENAIISLNRVGKVYEKLFFEFAKEERFKSSQDVNKLWSNLRDDKNETK